MMLTVDLFDELKSCFLENNYIESYYRNWISQLVVNRLYT